MNKNRGRRNKPSDKYKTNEKIRFPEVRVVEGIEPGVYDTKEALKEAESLGLDLVLITEKAKPPVCKIIDFGKFLYEEKKRKKEQESNQKKVVVKEMQFTPNIGEHDYEVKKKKVVEFLDKGNKVKVVVFFKGRTIMFKDQGELLLMRLASEVEEHGIPEAMPQLQGKRMSFIIKPKSK